MSLVCALIALGTACAIASARDRQPIKSYEIEHAVYQICSQGDELIRSKSYAQARDLLLKAASYDPTSYSSYVHEDLARCYRQLKSYQQAISETGMALMFEPDSEDAIYTRALTYYDMDDFDHATSCLQKYVVVSNDSNSRASAQKLIREIGAYSKLKQAARCIGSGRDQQARRYLEMAAQFDPSPVSAQVHGNFAYVLRRNGDTERAVEEAKKSLQFDPNDKSTVYTLGMAYGDLARFDEAIEWIQRYVAMENDAKAKENALNSIKGLEDDREQFNDPANKLPDYVGQLRSQDYCFTWPRKRLPLKVYISSGSGIFGYRPSFDALITRALDTWCDASGKKLDYVLVNDESKACLKVKWTPDALPATTNHPNVLPVGLTEPDLESVEQLREALISIRTVDPYETKRTLEAGECASVAMHEVGHALGVGHSTCMSDIMYFRSSYRQNGLPSMRDKATITRLYDSYPQLNFVPRSKAVTPPTFLPPPAFMPPRPPDVEKLTPPLFLPPPLQSEEKKLQPPLFTPPPVKSPKPDETDRQTTKPPQIPLFVPPPRSEQGKKEGKPANPPLFTPPPAK